MAPSEHGNKVTQMLSDGKGEPDFNLASQYVLGRLASELSPNLTYHSLTHTRDDVLPAATRLGQMSGVSGETLLLLETAALYHDTGFLLQYSDHESASIAIARATLPDFGYHPAQIDLIAALIGATRMPQRPQTPLQELICDADLDLLGRDDFIRLNYELYKEVCFYTGQDISDQEWLTDQLKFLEDHGFFTAAAITSRSEGKAQNVVHMRQRLEQLTIDRYQLTINN
jgi:uncharacterized protein